MAEPVKFPRLWGIWIPDGGRDRLGSWMQQICGECDSPMAFPDKSEAVAHADYEMDLAEVDNLTVHLLCGDE